MNINIYVYIYIYVYQVRGGTSSMCGGLSMESMTALARTAGLAISLIAVSSK